jgi:NAD-dependent deacetylase sirtuin 2
LIQDYYKNPPIESLEIITNLIEKIIVKFPSRKAILYGLLSFFFILSYFQYFVIFLDISKEKMLQIFPFNRLNDENLDLSLKRIIESLKFITHRQKLLNSLSNSDIKWINTIRTYNTKINQEKAICNIAKYIKEHHCKNIIVLSGAGISTNANIPDFRTPGTGLYSRLSKYNLPTPQSIFDIAYYRHNPNPFCHIAKEHYTKDYKPTLTHYFIRLLADHGLLLRNFTQNIDGLEEKAGLSDEYIIHAHGTYKTAHCVGNKLNRGCGKEYSQKWFKDKMEKMKKPICSECRGYVKPDIVFFGEELPISFWLNLQKDLPKCDLMIIMGTSLQVQPFASIPNQINPNIPRLLINKNAVGPFREFDILPRKNQSRDYAYLGNCDEGCLELAKALGLDKELMKLYENGQK